MSKSFIVLGDKTDHGGSVVSVSSQTDINGKPVARVGDQVACPKCKGVFPIAAGDATTIIDGQPVARHGDKTACGATLIAGQQSQVFIDG
ncbi:PAAR domain-containing protein [Lysobacter cavernae]|uniref:PAAR domain-containing protein n=1 Tax=Lysobacter cavernae TaxID=1685901 RepID=A0ABV7RRU0_9GAMM